MKTRWLPWYWQSEQSQWFSITAYPVPLVVAAAACAAFIRTGHITRLT